MPAFASVRAAMFALPPCSRIALGTISPGIPVSSRATWSRVVRSTASGRLITRPGTPRNSLRRFSSTLEFCSASVIRLTKVR